MKERKSAELGPLLSFSPQRKQAFLQQKTNARDPWWMDTHTGEGVACALGVCRERHCRCEVSALTLRSCEPSMDTLRPGERDARTHPTLGQRLRAYNFFFCRLTVSAGGICCYHFHSSRRAPASHSGACPERDGSSAGLSPDATRATTNSCRLSAAVLHAPAACM